MSSFRFLPSLVVLLFPLVGQAQTNLLEDPSFDASEPNTIENPSWTLEVRQPSETAFAAQYQSAGWASNPNGTAGIGVWLRAFLGSDADEDSGANAVLTQRVAGTPGLTYELSVWHKVETNYISASTLLAVDFVDASGEVILSEALELNGQHPADGSWVEFRVKATAPDGTVEVQARAEMVDGVNANANPQSAMFDDFFLTAIEPPSIAAVTGFEGGANVLRIFAEDADESAIDASTAAVTINGESVAIQSSKAAKITTFTHLPNTPWEAGSRVLWAFQAQDQQGEAIVGEGTLRIPGSLIFGGGSVTTQHAFGDGEVTDAASARAALASPTSEVTVETPWAHFEDGAAPPIYQDLSRPYPLFDPLLGGDESLGGADHFAILSTGQFYLKEGGTIPFAVDSDDGFEFRVNGELVGSFGNRARSSSIMTAVLEPGEHSFELLQWEAAGGAGVSLFIGRLPVLEGDMPPTVSEEVYELLSGYDVHEVVTEDTDGDGMDDFRENAFFGSLARTGDDDLDGDGLIDREELEAKADPTVRDTDGDGLEDGPEVAQHGSSPAKVDTDGDRLDDAREVNELKTDPAKADTDGDGFADNVELALATDPLLPDSKPDQVVASASGLWGDAETWMDGEVPVAGMSYLALGEVTPTILSSAGTFVGDALELRGPEMTLRLEHVGAASVNLTLADAFVALRESNRLEGVLNVTGDVAVDVANETTFELASQLRGDGNLHFAGADPDLVTSTVSLSGSGSQFVGGLSFQNVDARGAAAGSLGTGTITIANGSLSIGYALSSPAAVLQLRGREFELVLEEDVAVKDLVGLSEDGEELFSLLEVAGGSGPFTAEELLTIFQLDEGILGTGTLTLLRDAGDLDNDGLRDSWEVENFGDTASVLPEDDGDADGLDNLAEQTAGTNPKEADTDGDTLTDGDEIAIHQSDPTKVDTDDDGLDDAEEVALALNPGNPDTDGDGLVDGFERDSSMTDPGKADSDDDGFSDKAEIDNGADPLDPTSQPNQFVVRTIASDGAEIATLAAARALRDRTLPGTETLALHPTINFTDNPDLEGLVPGDVPFDGEVVDHFIVHAVGKFVVPTAGSWGIGFHSDDGGQLLIDGTEVIEFDGVRGRNATMRTLTLTEGEHTLEVLMFERIGGAALEVFRSAAPGEWDPVGNGALPAGFEPVAIEFARGETGVTPLPLIESIVRTEAGVQLGWQSEGPVGVDYSPDLEAWETIATQAVGTFTDEDPDRLTRAHGYYRVSLAP